MNTSVTRGDRLRFDVLNRRIGRALLRLDWKCLECSQATPPVKAAALFQRENKRALLELGAGQGRDTLARRIGRNISTSRRREQIANRANERGQASCLESLGDYQ
jgi:hypothetical protein